MRYTDVLRRERQQIEAVHADLRRRRWLRWHAFLLASICLGAGWAVSAGLMTAGVDSLALRWSMALGIAYLIYIGLLGAWCHWLVSRDEASDPGIDPGVDLPLSSADPGPTGAHFASGGGGDFAGGGAGASFDVAPDATGGAVEAAGHVVGIAASADEGAIVLVPLALAIGVALLIGSALGFAVFGLFGVEVMLGVAVEIVLASAGGAIAYKAGREGWLEHAVRRTVAPFAIVLALALLAGLVIEYSVPTAKSLPQAITALSDQLKKK
jgi:hypothetical protein